VAVLTFTADLQCAAEHHESQATTLTQSIICAAEEDRLCSTSQQDVLSDSSAGTAAADGSTAMNNDGDIVKPANDEDMSQVAANLRGPPSTTYTPDAQAATTEAGTLSELTSALGIRSHAVAPPPPHGGPAHEDSAFKCAGSAPAAAPQQRAQAADGERVQVVASCSTGADADAEREEGEDELPAASADLSASAHTGTLSRALNDAARSGLLSSMDLKTAMQQKHGWSAPWLPGLWLMPDGGSAATSLLLALQLYYEKEGGVEWRCPRGEASAAAAASRRRGGRAAGTKISERERREHVHEIPGFSEATARALPNMGVWEQLASGHASWERAWTDPYSHNVTKVIQVRCELFVT
jgi:hypothetical protein